MKVKKKPLLAIVLLIMITVIGFTIAYFTSSASFENVFNTGTYKVITTEVFESPSNWKPGEEIPKTITTTNEGTIPAAVRVSYTEKWEDKNGTDITSTIDEGTAIINLDNTSEWTKQGNYYYYNYILNPNETTSSFIKSVTLNSQLGSGDDVTCTPSQDGLSVTCEGANPTFGAKYILTLTKETVQADKYQEVWNTQFETRRKIVIGDELCYGPEGEQECFTVINRDSQNALLFAKYKLNATRDSQTNNMVYKQNSNSTSKVDFSTSPYWMDDNNQLKYEYSNNGEYSYDATNNRFIDGNGNRVYPSIYDDNSKISEYVKGYLDMLKTPTDGLSSSVTARLLTYDELQYATSYAYTASSDDPEYYATNYYWIDSALNNVDVHYEQPGGVWYNYYNAVSRYSSPFGVRPVLVVPISNL